MALEVTTGWINVNTGCQNRCASCYRLGDVVAKPKSMPIAMARQIIGFFASLRIYSCIGIGGEPTLYPDFPELIRMAKAGGIPEVSVVTNGRLLHKAELASAYADAGLDVFSITIHSAVPEIHDRITRCASWHETMAGIRNAVATGVKTSLNVVAGPENVDSVCESIRPLLDLGVTEIIVSCAIPRLCETGFDGADALEPKRFVGLVETLQHAPKNVVILHELPLCLLRRELFLELVSDNRIGFGCHVGTGRGLAVDVDGRTIPCNSFPNMGVLDLFDGGILRYTPDEFLALWEGSAATRSIRDAVNVYRSPICEQCGLWDFCNCGCPLTWGCFVPDQYINGSLVGVDPAEVAALSRIRFNP